MIKLSNTGYQNLTVSSKQRGSNTGPKDFKLQYSLDKTEWVDVTGGTITVANNFTSGVLSNVSLPAVCDDQHTLYLRWLQTTNNLISHETHTEVQAGGTNRIDDIIITGIESGPSITTSTASLSGFTYQFGNGPSTSQSFTVNGTNLADDLTISSPTNYEISTVEDADEYLSEIVFQPGTGSLQQTIYVRLIEGLAAGSYNGNITLNSDGAIEKTISCSGSVAAASGATLNVSPTTLSGFSYTVGSGHSFEMPFTVSGNNLTGNISITPPANSNYEISLGAGSNFVHTNPITLQQSNGSVSKTTIYVRLKAGLDLGPYSGEKLSITSTGANTKTVTCNGYVCGELIEKIVPQYMQGTTSNNNTKRMPTAFRFAFKGYLANKTFRFTGQMVTLDEKENNLTATGAGNAWFDGTNNGTIDHTGSFVRTTNCGLSSIDSYGELTTDANGDGEAWIIIEPTANEKFTPGNELYLRLRINDGAGGDTPCSYHTFENAVKVIEFGTAENATQGTLLRGLSASPAKNFLFVYDDGNSEAKSTLRPIAGTIIEDDGYDLTQNKATSIHTIYRNTTDNVNGAWAVIIPNILTSGITSIESRKYEDGSLYATAISQDGKWGNTNTKNPTGGDDNSTHLVIGINDATLPVELSAFHISLNSKYQAVLTWVTQTETGVNGFYLYRHDAEDLANACLISPLIPATNTSQQQIYVFTDTELYESGTYYYWLEVVNMDGSEEFYGPLPLHYGGISEGEMQVPLITGIKGLYPNPFNPETALQYSLSQALEVEICIYNNRGQLVRSYAPGTQEKGNHQIIWDGKDQRGTGVSSGVYYFRLQAGKDSYHRKAVLLK